MCISFLKKTFHVPQNKISCNNFASCSMIVVSKIINNVTECITFHLFKLTYVQHNKITWLNQFL